MSTEATAESAHAHDDHAHGHHGPKWLAHHFDTPALWTVAIREHREIAAAIARHDATGARAAMRRHMDHAAKRFSASWDKRKRMK